MFAIEEEEDVEPTLEEVKRFEALLALGAGGGGGGGGAAGPAAKGTMGGGGGPPLVGTGA